MAEGAVEMKRINHAALVFLPGTMASLASVILGLYMIVFAKQGCVYQYAVVSMIAFSVVTAVLSVVWARTAFKRCQYIIVTIASVMDLFVVLSVMSIVSHLHRLDLNIDYRMVSGKEFGDFEMMSVYRSARQALDASGYGETVIVELSNDGWLDFEAMGSCGTVYGSSGFDGIWALKRHATYDPKRMPKAIRHDVAAVLEEVGKRQPDLTNGVRRIAVSTCQSPNCPGHWIGCVRRRGHWHWHLLDDFKKFNVEDQNKVDRNRKGRKIKEWAW